jgi:hypothetical protein
MGCAAYLDLDEMTAGGGTAGGGTAGGEAEGSFASEQKAAHAPSVLIVLQSILQVRKEQFRANAAWVAPLLSSLSVCNDRAIRSAVKLVYDTHVTPIVVEACSK